MSKQLLPSDLDYLASAPQGLDNQYVPKKLLKTNKPLIELQKELKKDVRVEYLRSLLYTQQVVLNRAYIINSPAIYEDMLDNSTNKDTFLSFLEREWIVPWLYRETNFEEKPAFTVDPVGWESIQNLAKDVDVPYLRLSWDEQENIEKVNSLSKVFTGYTIRMVLVAEQIANSLGILDAEKKKQFTQRLNDVGKYCYDVFSKEGRNFITRDDMYKKFVCADKTSTVDGYYDSKKPFSHELKILFDLKYNVNLPDILNIQTLTGYGLPDRSALHEIDLILAGENKEGVLLDLPTLFSEIIMGKLSEAQWISSIGLLSLSDIDKARRTPEFGLFMKESAKLKTRAKKIIKDGVSSPLEYKTYFSAFNNYQKAIAQLTEKHIQKTIQPSLEWIINIGGVSLVIFPENTTVKLLGAVAGLDKRVASFTANLVAKGKSKMDLLNSSISQDIINTTLADPQGQVTKLLESLKKSGFEILQDAIDTEEEGSIEEPMQEYWISDY